ncbi:BRCA1-A complex subunit RAP80-like [Huso huso]|uniref:BRCA1-A complex subunit RAP80 n=1 Tax=Huso huso TaxID=61971 RepID=A0ABR0YTJ2_HUSHU
MPRKRRNPSGEEMAVSRRTRQRTNTNKNTSQSIVISDSESEEGDNGLVQRQDGRSLGREKTKRHSPEMTEEQMLDLAVRMSEQEANQRHEEEEEALKKAIEESLCENGVSHKADQSRPEGVQQNPGNKGKEKMHSTQPDASFPGESQWESVLGNANPKERSPVLVLEKLSQDVVGSCQELGFVACSQECPLTVTPLSAKRTSERNRLKRKLSFRRTDPVDSYRADGGESSSANLCSGKRRGQQGSTTPQEPETCQHPADAPHWPPVQEKRTCRKTEQNGSPLRMEEDASLNVITLDDFQDSESLLRSSSGPQCLQSSKQSPILFLGSQDVTGSCQEMSSLTCSQSPLTFSPLRSPLPSVNQDSPYPKSPTFPKRKNEGNRLRRTFSRRDTVHRNRADGGESSSADLSSSDGRGKQGSTPPQEPETSWHCTAAPREDSNTPLSCPSTPVATEGAGSMPRGEGAVHYYWGVPFCPQGLNPDDYTKVILCQLEVYEKSLKQAQRGLLRKAEWGEPVLTGPPETHPSRRTRLSRLGKGAGKSRSFQDFQSPRDSEQEGEEEESSQQDKEGRERREEEEQQEEEMSNSQQQAASSAMIRAEGTTETWLNLRRRRGLREERSPREPEEQQKQREEEEEEMDLDVCPETQLSEESSQPLLKDSPARTQSLEDVVEKPGSAPVSQRAQHVECPICMQSFPQNRIEMHAAYCDGSRESEEVVMQEEEEETASQVMSLRRSIRKAESSDAAEPSPSCSDRSAQKEKCYICQDWISVKEYQSHVDNCIRRGRNWKSKKLLAALEHSERKDSGNAEVGTSDSFFNHREDSGLVSCLDVEEQEPGSGGDEPACPFQLSDSPIRSYVPISQATDCLVDFKKQLTGPTEGQKRKRKRGRYR